MNGFHQALGRAVASKAGVYGFPLIIWSSGGLQVHRFGMRGMVGVLAFAGGGLVSMAVVVAISCRGLTCPLPPRSTSVRAFRGQFGGKLASNQRIGMYANGPDNLSMLTRTGTAP